MNFIKFSFKNLYFG